VILFAVLLGSFHIHYMLLAGDWDFWIDFKDRRMWPTVTLIVAMCFAAASQSFFWTRFRLPIAPRPSCSPADRRVDQPL
jgi:methane/ammonia monooxygenase subunit A